MRRLGGSRAGEIRLTRLLRNASVTPEAMVAEAALRTGERCAGLDVLVIQDTTVVRSDGGGGLYAHVSLAVDADSDAIVGLAHAQFLSRTAGKKGARKAKPVADKESGRWIASAQAASGVCCAARRITHICDREGDIFAFFARRPAGEDLLVRAAQDRALEDGGRLFAALDAAPAAGATVLDLPAKPGRAARQATIVARFLTAALARPANSPDKSLPASLSLTLVDIRELDPPPGADPVHWRLITTRKVESAQDAFALADLYRRRWRIEQLFRTLKTAGFDIEGALIEDEAPLKNLVMAAIVAAVIVQQLVHARDGDQRPGPLRPLADAFAPDDQPLLEAFCAKLEGKTERQKNPHPRGSLAYAAWVCARLGGWTGYYGKPGPVVMLNGWNYFQAAKHGALLVLNPENV